MNGCRDQRGAVASTRCSWNGRGGGGGYGSGLVGASQLVDEMSAQSWVHELGGSVVVIDVVDTTGSGSALFPSRGKWAERLLGHVLRVEVAGNAWIVPGADAGRFVVEIDLTLDGRSHFCVDFMVLGGGVRSDRDSTNRNI